MKTQVLITGATGMVGEGVLLECLARSKVENVLVINQTIEMMDEDKQLIEKPIKITIEVTQPSPGRKHLRYVADIYNIFTHLVDHSTFEALPQNDPFTLQGNGVFLYTEDQRSRPNAGSANDGDVIQTRIVCPFTE
jgi:hypothetical protein